MFCIQKKGQDEGQVARGTREGPLTVAPFRAWRGSRITVARGPTLVEASPILEGFRGGVHAEGVVPRAAARPLALPPPSREELRRAAEIRRHFEHGGVGRPERFEIPAF